MRQESIYRLKPGDIFATEIKLKGRCAYKVVKNDEQSGYVVAINRNTNKEHKVLKVKNQKIIFLRHE